MISALLFSWVTHFEYRLPWNPIPGEWGWYPYRINEAGEIRLFKMDGTPILNTAPCGP